MAGRAGRRCMEVEGFVHLRVNPVHVTYPEVLHLLHRTPEPIRSRFNTAYATLLNLYHHRGRALFEVFPQTLYYAQTSGARRQLGRASMERKIDLLSEMGYRTSPAPPPHGQSGS